MAVVDLSCDLGEGFGHYTIGHDAEVFPYLASASVGCGFHGGDPTTMRTSCQRARALGVSVGAHPGFPDLLGFGRRAMDVSSADIINYVLYQIGAFAAMCRAEGVTLQHVKPHGALYDMAAVDRRIAEAIVEAVARYDPHLYLYTTWNSAVCDVATKQGIPVVLEVFADRGVDEEGIEIPGHDLSLVGGSVEAATQRVCDALSTGELRTRSGKTIPWQANSVCFHGDSPDTLAFARCLRPALEAAGFQVRSPEHWADA